VPNYNVYILMISDGLCGLSKQSALVEYPPAHRHGTWWGDQPRIRRQRKCFKYYIIGFIVAEK